VKNLLRPNQLIGHSSLLGIGLTALLISLYLILVAQSSVGFSVAKGLSSHSQSFFLIVIIVSICLNRRQTKLKTKDNNQSQFTPILTCLGLAVCVIVAVNPVLLSWADSRWGYSKIGGVLPWSDAQTYYAGAYRLVNTEQLDSFNSRRPINAVMFAFRLLLSDGHLYRALVIQGLLFGLAFFYFLRELSKFVGFAGLVLAGAITYNFAAPFLDVTLSETLGLTLSFTAAAMMLRFVSNGRAALYYSSVLLFSLAVGARSGPYFVLILLVMCAPVMLANSHFQRFRAFSTAVFCSLGGTVYNMAINTLYGSSALDQNANFGYVLYGLAKGGLGWTAINSSYFADRVFNNEAEIARAVFVEALKSITTDPLLFAKGLWLGLKTYLDLGLYGFTPGVISYIFFTFFVLGCVVVGQKGINPRLRMLLLVWLVGLLVSIPFIFQDGGFRVTATGLPILVILPALGMSLLEKQKFAFLANSTIAISVKETVSKYQGTFHRRWALQFPPLLLMFMAMLMIAILPKIVDVGLVPSSSMKMHGCNSDETVITAELGPRSPAILHSETLDSSVMNSETTASYKAHIGYGIEIADALHKVPPGTYLVEAMNQATRQYSSVFLLVAQKDMPDRPRLEKMCGTHIDDPIGAKYKMFNVRFLSEQEE
jgi:hypothetical protein